MRLPLCLALGPALLWVLPAQAQVIIQPHTANALTYCPDSRLFSAANAEAPDIIAASFNGEGKRVAFRTCRDGDGNTHYFIREPRPNRNGVCRTFEQEVFAGTPADSVQVRVLYDGMAPHWYFNLKGWKYWPPDEWALLHYARQSAVLGFVTPEACPLGDDPRYINLGNVTDGMLTSFKRAWDTATRTPAALEKAFATVPTVTSFTGAIDAQPSQRLRASLQKAVFERHEKIEGIFCSEGGCTAWLGSVSVSFDATPTGIALRTLNAVWQA